MIRRFFRWLFKEELTILEQRAETLSQNQHHIESILDKLDVSVDVHERHSPSWAVISIQGKSMDYIQFVDLGHKDIYEISKFLRHFSKCGNIKVDTFPTMRGFLKIKKR